MTDESLESLLDRGGVESRLAAAGLAADEVQAKAELFDSVASALRSEVSNVRQTAFAWYVPGRIEVLGKHTDYAGGRSLTAAASQGFCAVAASRDDSVVRMIDVAGGRVAEIPMSAAVEAKAGDWANYPTTVVQRLSRNFGCRRGASIAFASDLPQASGMSSSSAFIIATLVLLADVNDLPRTELYQRNIQYRLALAGYAATIENGQNFGELLGDKGVGTFGGSEDHTAILDSRAGALGQYSYCPVKLERRVPVAESLVFAIASSGVAAEKTGAAMAKYNRASLMAAAVADVWRKATGRGDAHIAAAIASSPDAMGRLRDILRSSNHPAFSPDELSTRFEHVYAESEEIVAAVPAELNSAGLARFGALVDRSQKLAEQLLGNQIPETALLASSARELGAHAASAFGAGFGGSVWALIERSDVDRFLADWRKRYQSAFPQASQAAMFLVSRPGPAAFAL